MSELFSNLSRSTLASGILAGDLSLTVASGDGNALFPVTSSPDFFRAVLFRKATGDIEIVNVTNRSVDVFTITRAQEDIGNVAAAAFAFDAGDLIELRPTSAFFTSLAAGATSTNIQQDVFRYGVAGGSANALTVAMTPAATALVTGMKARVTASLTSTSTTVTLKLDGLAAKNIKMHDGTVPPVGAIVITRTYDFFYNGTNFILQGTASLVQLSSNTYSANSKKIGNVAAGTANADVATIGNAETLLLKTLVDPVLNNPSIVTGSNFPIKPKVIDLGAWNMVGNKIKSFAHGLTSSKIRTVQVSIVPDSGFTQTYDYGAKTSVESSTSNISWDTTNITLTHAAGGAFDNVAFDDPVTPNNRGWITIWYID